MRCRALQVGAIRVVDAGMADAAHPLRRGIAARSPEVVDDDCSGHGQCRLGHERLLAERAAAPGSSWVLQQRLGPPAVPAGLRSPSGPPYSVMRGVPLSTSSGSRGVLVTSHCKEVHMTRRFLVPLALTGALLASCTVVREPAPPPKVVYREVPPPVTEVRPPPPSAAHNWVPGHYVWGDNAWRWEPGHYVTAAVRPMPPLLVEEVPIAPSPAHFYVRGHWRWNGTDWVWVRGRWISS